MLTQMLNIVKKNSDIKSQTDFMFWFLKNEIDLPDSTLKYLFTGQRQLRLKDKIKLLECDNWNLRPFGKKIDSFKKEIVELHGQIFGKTDKQIELNQCLSDFLKYYLFNTLEPYKKLRPYKISPCQNYIEIDEYDQLWEKAWKQSNIMIIYGKGGMGKTQLVKAYIKNKQDPFNEVCMLDGCVSVEEGLLGMPFLVSPKRNIENIIDILKSKDNNTLLVIDIPIIRNSDISFIEKNLLGLNLVLV